MTFRVETVSTKDDKRLLAWQKEDPLDYNCSQTWIVSSHCYQMQFKIKCPSEKALELRTLEISEMHFTEVKTAET